MLHADLTVDLPSDLPEPPGVVRRLVAWLVGHRGPLDEELETLLVDNLTIFEGLLGGFGAAGFDDVVSVVIDGKPAYVDTEEKIGDIAVALEGAVKRGAVSEGFDVLRATLTRSDEELLILAQLRARARVPEGTDECTVRVSARVRDLDVRADEGPKQFAQRVRDYVRAPQRLQAHSDRIAATARDLAATLPKHIAGASVGSSPVEVRVIAPGPRQVGRFRHLGFGEAHRPSVYNALPQYERIGPYDDPINDHYYSPYSDLLHWILLGEVLAGQWALPQVKVFHPSGPLLFTGERASAFDPSQLDVARDAVRVSPEGRLVVDDAVPQVASLDPAEAGNPNSPGWAGEQWADAIADEGPDA